MADTYSIDRDGPAPSEEWDGPINDNVPFVEVPHTDFPLGDETREILTATIDPTRDSEFNGVDIYLETVHLRREILQ